MNLKWFLLPSPSFPSSLFSVPPTLLRSIIKWLDGITHMVFLGVPISTTALLNSVLKRWIEGIGESGHRHLPFPVPSDPGSACARMFDDTTQWYYHLSTRWPIIHLLVVYNTLAEFPRDTVHFGGTVTVFPENYRTILFLGESHCLWCASCDAPPLRDRQDWIFWFPTLLPLT